MRREQNKKSFMPAMPPVTVGRYLLDYLFELGPAVPNGMGSSPVPFSEIDKWSELTGIPLQPWEVRTLRRLSQDYVNEAGAATKHDAEEPWDTQERIRLTDLQRKALRED